MYDYPPLVEKLGSSPTCSVQGMHIPRKLITVQGHPEFNEEIMTEILKARHAAGLFDDTLYQDAIARAKAPQDGLHIAAAFLRFMMEGQ